MPIVDTYPMNLCAKQIFQDYWPKNKEKGSHDWNRDMKVIQAELIRCHVDEMDAETARRAIRTLQWLEHGL